MVNVPFIGRVPLITRDDFIGRKLTKIRFVLVLVMKKQIGLIRFSFDREIINRFDLISFGHEITHWI